jgi:hypothetical protein
MPLFQSSHKQPAQALTKDGARIIAYALTPAAVRRLRGSGVRHGRKFPAAILASLIRSGDAYSPRVADHPEQISLFGDDDTADQLPRCEMTGSTADLHLVVYGEALGTVAKLLGTEPRFLLQKATKLSIPIWSLSASVLNQLEATGSVPGGTAAATALRHWFRRNYDAAWEKLLASNGRQDDLDLGPASGELPLSDKK